MEATPRGWGGVSYSPIIDNIDWIRHSFSYRGHAHTYTIGTVTENRAQYTKPWSPLVVWLTEKEAPVSVASQTTSVRLSYPVRLWQTTEHPAGSETDHVIKALRSKPNTLTFSFRDSYALLLFNYLENIYRSDAA